MKLLFAALLVLSANNVPAQLTLQGNYYSHKQQCSFVYSTDQKWLLKMNPDQHFYLTKSYFDSRFGKKQESIYKGTWELKGDRVYFDITYSSVSLIPPVQGIEFKYLEDEGKLIFVSAPKFSDFPSSLSTKRPADF